MKIDPHVMLWLVNVWCSSVTEPHFLLQWTETVSFLHYTMGQTGLTAREMTAALHSDFELSESVSIFCYLYGILSIGRAEL